MTILARYTLDALFALFAVGHGEGGSSAVGVGDGVSIHKAFSLGLFDLCYRNIKLCVDGGISSNGSVEIEWVVETCVLIPAHKDIAIENRVGQIEFSRSLCINLFFPAQRAIIQRNLVGVCIHQKGANL